MSKRTLYLRLRVSSEELTALRELARAEGVSVSDLIRRKLGLAPTGRVKNNVS